MLVTGEFEVITVIQASLTLNNKLNIIEGHWPHYY